MGTFELEEINRPEALMDIQNAIVEVRNMDNMDSPIGQCATTSLLLETKLQEKGYETVVMDGSVKFNDTTHASHTWLFVHLPNVIDHEAPFLLVDPTIDQFTSEIGTEKERMVTTNENIPNSFIIWPWDEGTEWYSMDHMYVQERWGPSRADVYSKPTPTPKP